MGGGKGGSKAPPPIDPGKSMGEYLFGKGFSSQYQGITDPLLQERLIGAERTYRPQYTALELADIGVMARGLEAGAENPEYARLEAELAGLQAGQEVQGSRTKADLEAQAQKLYPNRRAKLSGRQSQSSRQNRTRYNKGQAAKRAAFIKAIGDPGQDRAARIAQIETQMQGMSPTLDATPGLFDLLEEQSTRAGALQRKELELQRASDVGALQEFAPQVVDAYRAADPYSTALADEATARAMDPRLMEKGQALLNAKMQAASAAESALQSSGLKNINAIRESASAAESSLQSSGLDNVNAKREAASAAEQELNKLGMSLSDLSPTEQEAILSGRGMEFAASTGELTALEKRRAQQSSRQASVSRGRGMDQSAIYGEMEARMAEELNKQEREISLGASLLGQQADMRLSRLGQGANILAQAEDMDAQRRAEQLQRQQFGAGLLTQSEAMNAQRRAEQLQRQQFGSDQLRTSESIAAQKRAEQLQRIQLGSGLIGQADQQLQGAFGMNRQLAGDVGMTLLGRTSSSIGLGGQMLGQAQQGAAGPMGPQLFDPNVGINMALQQRGQDVTFQGMQAQAKAAGQAGAMEAAGSVASAALPLMFCWVAREVYGIESSKWLQFRKWMLNDSPSWFRKLYIKYGERFAKFISNKPRIKSIIRNWMNTKIK